MRVAVVGAGISGLTAAWVLAGAGLEVEVLEASGLVGGKLRIARVGGVEVDVGAEAMLARRPEGLELAAALGVPLIHPRTAAAMVRAGGVNHQLPAGTVLGVPGDLEALAASGVLSVDALAQVAAEPSRAPLPPLDGDLAIGGLVRARLGDEVADRLVEPLLGGVYAGRADAISLAASAPTLAGALRSGGSLVQAAAAIPTASGGGPVFASVPGGLAGLAAALASSGRFDVQTGVPVRRIQRRSTGFELVCGSAAAARTRTVDAVVVATPAPQAARLLAEPAPIAAAVLSGIELASVGIVTLAFEHADLPPGSGLLIGAQEGFHVKGVTLTSQKWPLAPGPVLLRASVGRAGETRTLQRSDAELISLVRRELADLIGLDAEPADASVTRWGGGLPQYAVGHLDRMRTVLADVAGVSGLAVCGATYAGVGVPACIASGRAAAAHVLACLSST